MLTSRMLYIFSLSLYAECLNSIILNHIFRCSCHCSLHTWYAKFVFYFGNALEREVCIAREYSADILWRYAKFIGNIRASQTVLLHVVNDGQSNAAWPSEPPFILLTPLCVFSKSWRLITLMSLQKIYCLSSHCLKFGCKYTQNIWITQLLGCIFALWVWKFRKKVASERIYRPKATFISMSPHWFRDFALRAIACTMNHRILNNAYW